MSLITNEISSGINTYHWSTSLFFLSQNNFFYAVLLARQDVKPGVSMLRRVKETMKKEAQQKENNIKNRQKTFKEQEKESREAALHSSISNENKGFALLQKMGYKAGQGLGKQGKCSSFTLPFIIFKLLLYLQHVFMIISITSAGAGRVDPIPLNIKTGKQI